MNREKQADGVFNDKNVLRQIAAYTILNGSVLGGANSNGYGTEIYRKREAVVYFFKKGAEKLLDEGKLSNISYQVLSNANQKLAVKNPDLEEVIDYVSLWMKKIEMREELTADEELIKEIFSVDTVLKDLDITQLEEQLRKNHENPNE